MSVFDYAAAAASGGLMKGKAPAAFTGGYSSSRSPYGSYGSSGFGQSAYGTGPSAYRPSKYQNKYGTGIQRWEGQAAKMALDNSQFQGGGTQIGGQDWAGVEQWSSAIEQAAAAYGVPAALIKAVMQLESGGNPNAAGAPGVWGPMQVNSNAWGNGPWMSDPVANIMKGAEILKSYYTQYGDWRMALRGYHGFGSDGYTTDLEYADIVMNNWQMYGQYSGGAGAGMGYNPAQSRPGAAWITQMFGNVAIPADFEFNIPSTNNLYGYGASYGMNGTNHTGIDVPLPVNTPYYAPLSGIVTCAGTGYGSGADGGGCAAFGDDFGSGAGRVEVQLSNGVVLIYGHSSKSLLKPGDTFQAGQQIGTSGGQLSPHIHLEARVRDASTPSGWRIVDARTVLGSTGGWNNAPSGGYNQAPQSGGAWWQNVDPGTVAAKIQSGGW